MTHTVTFSAFSILYAFPVPYRRALRSALRSAQRLLFFRAFFEGSSFSALSWTRGSSQNMRAADTSASILLPHTSPLYSLLPKRSSVSESQRGLKVAVRILDCLVDPEWNITRFRMKQAPHCESCGWQMSMVFQYASDMFKSATLLTYIMVSSVSCNIMQLSHMKKSTVALFTWWPYLLASKPHSRPRTGDRRDSGLCAPLEGLGHYQDGVDRKLETRWKLSDEKWKTYSCEEVVQNAEHRKLQGEQMEWKNAARHVVKEISKSPKLEKLKRST